MGLSLILLVVVPMVGALVGALLTSRCAARSWAFFVSLATAAIGVWAALEWRANGIVQYVDTNQILSVPRMGFSFGLRMDAISMWLVLLTVLLAPLAIAASWESIQDRAKEYYAWMLLLLSAMLGVFVANDLLLFYVFFELTLIPMFFIIGIWGGPERRYAASKFFLFTFAGSVFTLAVVIFLGLGAVHHDPSGVLAPSTPSFNIDDVVFYAQSLPPSTQIWVVLGLLAGFAVKVPLFPVHTWLPLAHTEAPTAGSVILAGVLLKLGTYGILRLALPMGLINSTGAGTYVFPHVIQILGVLCVIGIIYGALVAWVQTDIKKLVAYSSVSHLGFCVLGLLAMNDQGMQGSVLYMINHGLSTGALFLVIGMIYDRYHTRDINQLSGLARKMPVLAFFFVLFSLSSIGLPGLNGFVSEFLTILGAFVSDHLGPRFGALAALGIILGAVYMLHMVAHVIWGPLKVPAIHHEEDSHSQEDQGQAAPTGHSDHAGHGSKQGHDDGLGDIGRREIAILIPLALLIVLLGVQPNIILKSIAGPLRAIRTPTEHLMASNPKPQPAATIVAKADR